MRFAIIAAVLTGSLAVSGCTTPTLKNTPGYGQGSGKRMGGAALRLTANPGEVATTDIAFSRAARDEGQWTAFRRFAADGAKIHGKDGVIEARPWLASQSDPDVPVQWTPTAVWSSCDGSTAVTQGKFAEPDGTWGYYVTVWERQRDGRYRWVYDMGAPDDQLTASENAKRKRDAAPRGDNVVVIEAIQAIQGRVADCLDMSSNDIPLTVVSSPSGGESFGGYSQDKTLQWTSFHSPDGSRSFLVHMPRENTVQLALSFQIGPDGKHIPDQ